MWIFLAVPVLAGLLTGAIGRWWAMMLPLSLAVLFCWGFYYEWWGNGYDTTDNPYLAMLVILTIVGAWAGLLARWVLLPDRFD